MGHIRLGTLPQSKKWQDVVGLLESDAPLDAVAEAAARASEYDLKSAASDPGFQFVTGLLVRLPFLARASGFEDVLAVFQVTGVGADVVIGLQRVGQQAHADAGRGVARTDHNVIIANKLILRKFPVDIPKIIRVLRIIFNPYELY